MKVFDASVLEKIDAWPETQLAVGRGQDALRLRNPKNNEELSPTGYGIMPDREYQLRKPRFVAGREVRAAGRSSSSSPPRGS